MKKVITLSIIFLFAAAALNSFGKETKSAKTAVKETEKVKEIKKTKKPVTKETQKSEKKMTDKNSPQHARGANAKSKDQIAVIETSMGTFKFKFLKDKAPNTCDNFIKLAEKGYYDGLIYHRVIPNFMIQGGCPDGKGTGGPGYSIKAEFNDVKHLPGIVSMARSADPDSAGSQFFICIAPVSHLDGQYTAFGEVIEGYDVVDKIGKVKTLPGDRPVEPVIMKKVTIE